MHILMVHNYYKIRGGEDECFEADVQLLREHGHHVDIYEEHNARISSLSKVQLALKTIWSQKTYQTIQRQLQQHPYDVVHVQNFFPLISPAIYYAARSAGVPVIQTLHNYRLLCPNALFFRHEKICEDCTGKIVPYPGVLHGCYRNNTLATAGVASMLALHQVMRTWTTMVDRYVTVSEFARQKFIAGGLPTEKLVVKPNFVQMGLKTGKGQGGYALYVGRLSTEKGLDTLLEAWEQIGQQIPLKIVGTGLLADQVKEAVMRLPNVEWLGRRPMAEVYDLMGEAMFLVFPSKWYETFGRVAIESFAKGTPVLAAKIGALTELVDSGRTGLHFRPGDPDDLVKQVKWFLANPTQVAQMRQAARSEFEAKYTAERNYQNLMDIYTMTQTPAKQLTYSYKH